MTLWQDSYRFTGEGHGEPVDATPGAAVPATQGSVRRSRRAHEGAGRTMFKTIAQGDARRDILIRDSSCSGGSEKCTLLQVAAQVGNWHDLPRQAYGEN